MDKKESVNKNKPTKPGVYWARKSGEKWWSTLILIEGEPPYMRYRSWYMGGDYVSSGLDPSEFWFAEEAVDIPCDPVPGPDEKFMEGKEE